MIEAMKILSSETTEVLYSMQLMMVTETGEDYRFSKSKEQLKDLLSAVALGEHPKLKKIYAEFESILTTDERTYLILEDILNPVITATLEPPASRNKKRMYRGSSSIV